MILVPGAGIYISKSFPLKQGVPKYTRSETYLGKHWRCLELVFCFKIIPLERTDKDKDEKED